MSSIIDRIRDRRRTAREHYAINRALGTATTPAARAEIEFFMQRQPR